MKRIAFSLLSVVMLIVMALPIANTAVLAGEDGIANLTTSPENTTFLDYIVISPDNASIKGDGEETQAYTAEAFDAQGNSLGDVTQDTEFTIQPEAGGSWDGNEYTSLYGGTWEVTGSYTDGNVTLTDTATLYVIESRAHQESKTASPDLSTRDSEPDTTIEPRRVDQANSNIPPYLNITKSVSPDLICIDDTATVTLNITGAGNATVVERVPLDVILIIDRSGSMGWDSPTRLSKAKEAAKAFVGNLNSSLDRVGLVSFATTAAWNRILTSNFTAVNVSIDAMYANGATCIGCGINYANNELTSLGRPEAVHVEILLTDGNPNEPNGPGNGFYEADAQYARNLTQAAHNANITLYTIGLGSGVSHYFLDAQPGSNHTYNPGDPAGNPYLHDGLAYIGGGKYYFAPTSDALLAIFEELAYEVTSIAGKDIVVTEILDAGVNCTIWGTNNTWTIPIISINQSWEESFNVTFDEAGYQPVDAVNAHINYTDYQGNPASQPLPEAYITVIAKPVANFTAAPNSTCVNTTVQFTDLSTGKIDSWLWNFGDGSTNTTQNTSHQYSAAGNYTVSLNVTNECGSNTTTKIDFITVTAKPIADFVVDNNSTCVDTPVQFTDNSTGKIDSWTWDFPGGNPANATGQGPHNVTYSTAGNYTVNLTVSNACGSNNMTKIDYITVKAAPVANFTANVTNPCVNASVNFTDLSTPAGEIDNWTWDFPGGTPSNATGVGPHTVTYSVAGTYTVNLTVTNACGNDTESKSNYITVKAAPVADFSASDQNPCVNTDVNFTDLSTPSDNINSWSWDFGDGSTNTTQNTSHQYSAAGNYTVSLNVTNECGSNTTTKIDYITITAPPVAAFSANPPSGYAPLTVTFTDESTGTIDNWTWDFPGGSPSNATGQGPQTVTYSAVGTYTVSLNVSNNCGSNTTSTPVTVIAYTPAPGGGGGGGGTCYLDIDMLGKITRVRISCITSRTLESKVAPDFNNTNLLEIDLGTQVLCDDLGRRPEVLVMRLANETPPVPDGSALVSPVYNFTGNYSSFGYHNTLGCCSGVTFDQNITLVLNYDPNALPESTASLAVAYYDKEQGIWVALSPDMGRVAEIGEATGLINHFSTVAIIAELAPTPAPASFVTSALSIKQSPLAWKNIFVGVTGKDVTITANVANNGGQEGTYTAVLKLNGKTVATRGVTLAAGQSQQVSFTLPGMNYGQYKVEIAGLSGEFTVSRSINWWLIIGIIAAVGLITWAAIWWRKRRKKATQSE